MATFDLLYGDWLDEELRTDDRSIRFTTARRKRAVNEGMSEFTDLTECFVKQVIVTCSCNTSEYDMNSSVVMGGSTDFIRWATQGVEYRLRSSGASGETRSVGGDDPRPSGVG